MSLQDVRVAEALVAVRTRVRLHVVVNALMSLQVPHVAEAGAACGARVLALAFVHCLDVQTQRLVLVEGLVTLWTGVLLHVEAAGEMQTETVGLRELGAAVRTRELLFRTMDECVLLELVEPRRAKRAAFVQTPEHLYQSMLRHTVLPIQLKISNGYSSTVHVFKLLTQVTYQWVGEGLWALGTVKVVERVSDRSMSRQVFEPRETLVAGATERQLVLSMCSQVLLERLVSVAKLALAILADEDASLRLASARCCWLLP